MRLIMTTLFGVESVTAGELADLGYARERIRVSDGQVRLDSGDQQETALAIARLNVNLRTAERVLAELAEFPAPDFDTLFDAVNRLPWEEWLAPGIAFHVNGYARKSALTSIPACQSLIKKAIVSRLLACRGYRPDSQLPEDPSLGLVKIQFSIVENLATLMIDTSGESLHKRGYRPLLHEAPIRETLAAAMLMVSQYRPGCDEAVFDPFCGSGTIPVEAGMMAMHIAPGLKRPFSGEGWHVAGQRVFDLAREEAAGFAAPWPKDAGAAVFGSDISSQAVSLSLDNAKRAGVLPAAAFRQSDVRSLSLDELSAWAGYSRLLVICNPPYGERSLDLRQAEELYGGIGRIFLDRGMARPGVRLSVITPHEGFERLAGGPADKRRKLYNGMIKCTLYHYFKQRR